MRTIKFKGKRIDNGEWVAGDLAHSLDGRLNILGFNIKDGVTNFSGAYLIGPKTVCQFTGFLDKNGKEIYEGDVLRSNEYPYSCLENDERDNYYAVVYYCEERSCFGIVTAKNPDSDVRGISDGIPGDVERENMKRFEVVGNIHDKEWKQYGEYFQTKEETEAEDD